MRMLGVGLSCFLFPFVSSRWRSPPSFLFLLLFLSRFLPPPPPRCHSLPLKSFPSPYHFLTFFTIFFLPFHPSLACLHPLLHPPPPPSQAYSAPSSLSKTHPRHTPLHLLIPGTRSILPQYEARHVSRWMGGMKDAVGDGGGGREGRDVEGGVRSGCILTPERMLYR